VTPSRLGLTVSAIVSSRNRPADAFPCVSSILRNPDLLELVFIDQSDTFDTRDALQPIADARLKYVRSEQRGLSNGRNQGIALSKGDILAYTDDDCRTPADWVSKIRRVFIEDADALVVCGRVVVPPELADKGFTTGFEPADREWQHRYPGPAAWGIGANMSIRRSAFDSVGVFDPFLGAGAVLPAGEELDFMYRVLKAGFKVINASEVELTHLGTRPAGDATRTLWSSYGAGAAAVLAKHIRLGDPDAIRLYLEHLSTIGRWVAKSLFTGRRPLGARYMYSLLAGAAASFKYSVDRQRKLYAQR
jgi:GT2 family glycosyltransferase